MYPQKTPDLLQNMPHTKAQNFQPRPRLEPALQHWWHAVDGKAAVLPLTSRVSSSTFRGIAITVLDHIGKIRTNDKVSPISDPTAAGIAQLVVFGLAVHSVAGSILLWGHFPIEGIFPLGLTWVQTLFPQKLFRIRV